ncbi:MAG: xanthine dehydrogenase family protein molybdopterin-binding subunit [Paucibacter sp.]|nr:xanthine dehydrogenase family protein molybdopterin-binding subunit [Roseateles sp.]
MKRRTLLLSGLGAAGALIVGFGALPPRSRLGKPELLPVEAGEVALNGWIKIAADGRVLLAMNRSEMGQGVHTALAQLVAEELGVETASIGLVPAGFDAIYGNVATLEGTLPLSARAKEPGHESTVARLGQWTIAKLGRELGLNLTGGSSSMADAWEPLRWAAATARQQLVAAAAARWKVPASGLKSEGGEVRDGTGRALGFGALAADAAKQAPGDVTLKPREQWRQIGRAVPRTDLHDKVTGRARFGIDQRPEGLLFAAVRHAPMLGGEVGAITPAAVDQLLQMPQVLRLVRLPAYAGGTEAIAVIARTSWHAMRAAQQLEVEWRAPAGGPAVIPDTQRIAAELAATARRAADEGFAFASQGDVDAALRDVPRRVEALYEAPYLAHATMEPMNATARVADGRVELWLPTQVPGQVRALAARVAGVDADKVSVHVSYLGGGFGRRLDIDFAGQAVRVAMEAGGAPVQLLWPREEDMTHDFYRPAGAAFMQAGLDSAGRALAWRVGSAGDAITPRWLARVVPPLSGPIDTPDKTASEGLFDQPYAVPNQRIAHVATHQHVPVGMWRAVGHSHNAFFTESFIDELAHAAGADPVAYRLSLLDDLPRHAAVLRLAAEKAGWGTPLPAGRARGVALHESFGTIVAEVVEVTNDQQRPRVLRVVCALDCGSVINPGIVTRQMEGAVVFGLTAALHGRIDIVDGVVRQKSFPDYPLLGLAETPQIDVHMVPSTNAPTGIGEPGVPPLAPALANAWFALTGERRRRLPLVA